MKIEVSPLAFDGIGFYECKEEDAVVFGVYCQGYSKSYGNGTFPAYDSNMNYRYKTRAEAEVKARQFKERKKLS